MKQVPYRGPTNIRKYCTKFSHLSKIITGMCAPFFSNYILSVKPEVLMTVAIKKTIFWDGKLCSVNTWVFEASAAIIFGGSKFCQTVVNKLPTYMVSHDTRQQS